MFSNELQSPNVLYPIHVTLSGIITLPVIPAGTQTIAVKALLYKIPPRLAYIVLSSDTVMF